MPTFLVPRCESLNPAQTLGFRKFKKMQGVKFADQKHSPALQNARKIPQNCQVFRHLFLGMSKKWLLAQ